MAKIDHRSSRGIYVVIEGNLSDLLYGISLLKRSFEINIVQENCLYKGNLMWQIQLTCSFGLEHSRYIKTEIVEMVTQHKERWYQSFLREFSNFFGLKSAIYEKRSISPDRLREIRSMSYKLYLLTPEWRRFREKLIKATGRCQLCGNKQAPNYHVHHNDYNNRGREMWPDVIVLCSRCHYRFHFEKYIIPYISIEDTGFEYHEWHEADYVFDTRETE